MKSNDFTYIRPVWQGVTAVAFPSHLPGFFPFPSPWLFSPQLFSILSCLLYTPPCVSFLPLLLLLIHFIVLCELHGIQPTAFARPKIRASEAVCLHQLLLFCAQQRMQLIFRQTTAAAAGTLHTPCPGAKRVPLAINTSGSV